MKYFILLSLLLIGCAYTKHGSDVVCTMTWKDDRDTTYSCTGKDITKGLADRKYREYLEDLEEKKKDEQIRKDKEYKKKHQNDRSKI